MSSTSKRSVMTLVALAGVVAAAGPASDRLTGTGTVAIVRGGWPDGTPSNRVGFTPPIGTDKGSLTLPLLAARPAPTIALGKRPQRPL